MKKVGIITFHRARNFGAMLQAYALQESLSDHIPVSIVDYRSNVIESMFYTKPSSAKGRIKNIIKKLFFPKHMQKVKQKNELFDQFRINYLKTSETYNNDNIEKANDKYDIFIAGSDQIWNMRMTKKDLNYLLAFAAPEKRYSYAASFGSDTVDNDEIEQIKKELLKFKLLLMREESGLKIIQNLGIIDIPHEVVLDPVFLLSKNQWIEKLKLSYKKKNYILVYLVMNQTSLFNFVKKMKRETSMEVIYINHYGQIRPSDKEFTEIITIGPKEFLELILNAYCVVTTSFHAMAFSMIFNVPFFYELDKGGVNNNTRLVHLSKMFSVEGREIISDDMAYNDPIDWIAINNKIALQSSLSKDAIVNPLKKVCSKN